MTYIAEATVNPSKITGNTVHSSDSHILPAPKKLRIVQLRADSGYYLYHFDENDCEQTDTYHDTVEDALDQAAYEFGLTRDDWTWMHSP
jgi:hypothetical protein